MSLTEWSAREQAIWDYLEAQPSYQALGLNEYRGHMGELIPFEPRLGVASSAMLPAIYSMPPGFRSSLTGTGYVDTLEVPMGVISHAQAPNECALAPGRAGIESAATVLRDMLTDVDARSSRFGASEHISTLEFNPLRMSAVAMQGAQPGTVSFWHFEFTLAIEGSKRPRNR